MRSHASSRRRGGRPPTPANDERDRQVEHRSDSPASLDQRKVRANQRPNAPPKTTAATRASNIPALRCGLRVRTVSSPEGGLPSNDVKGMASRCTVCVTRRRGSSSCTAARSWRACARRASRTRWSPVVLLVDPPPVPCARHVEGGRPHRQKFLLSFRHRRHRARFVCRPSYAFPSARPRDDADEVRYAPWSSSPSSATNRVFECVHELREGNANDDPELRLLLID